MDDKERTEKELDTELSETPEDSIEEAVLEPDFKDQWMRALADLDNARRRFEKEKEDIASYAIVRFAKELLPISDNLARALGSGSDTENPLYQGVVLTQKELEKVFQKFGIHTIEALNQPFDPNRHQAMLEEDNATVSPGTIVSVLQEGYTLHDRLLRPSLVCVAKAQAPST